MSNSFLPPAYKVPTGSDQFMKFQQGDNEFRILSEAVTGYGIFGESADGKLKSYRKLEEEGNFTPSELLEIKPKPNKDGSPQKPKHFMYFLVYNYDAKKFQVLELTQMVLKKTLINYVENKKYGDPRNYDFTVNKKGEGMDIEYTMMASPPEPLAESIQRVLATLPYKKFAMIDGSYPFEE